MNMSNEYKMLFLENGKMYLSEVVSKKDGVVKLKNPLLVEYKYNTENNPVFRYVPWQILSKSEEVELRDESITMMTDPKVEILDVYQRICIAFIPVERDEDD